MIVHLLKASSDALDDVMSWLLIRAVKIYQMTLRPWLGQQCRFHPTCSSYAIQAIERRGPWQGSALAIARIARCNPFHPGGVDDVPVDPNSRLLGDR